MAIGNQASEVVNLATLEIRSGIGTRDIERLDVNPPKRVGSLSALRYEVSKGVDPIEESCFRSIFYVKDVIDPAGLSVVFHSVRFPGPEVVVAPQG